MSTAQVINFPDPEIVQLARQGLALKQQRDAIDAELKGINARLAELAEYKPNSSTGHVRAGGVHVTVSRKEYVKWEQPVLENVRAHLGDETFFRLFKWEFEPRSSRDVNAFLEFGDEHGVALIRQAMTTKPGAPSVKYELESN